METLNKFNIPFTLAIMVLCATGLPMIAQDQPPPLENRLRLNFLNPGVDYEIRTSELMVLSIGGGIGYSGEFEELSGNLNRSGFRYLIAPFLDLQYKLIYNRRKRSAKKKSLAHNAGNFVSLRGLWRGPTIAENINRLDSNDFMLGVTWGFQRSYNKIHLLFDMGPVYYFDTKANDGFLPFMLQLNIGLNL